MPASPAARRRVRWALVAAAAVLLASCGSSDESSTSPSSTSSTASETPTSAPPPETAPAADGAALFAADLIGGEAGCSSCHSLQPDRSTSGPSLAGIGTTATSRVPGLDAETYLRQSIVEPEAVFAPGWGAGMPAYGDVLTPDELDAVVAYLVSLG